MQNEEENDIETGLKQFELNILPTSSPPLLTSYSSPPTTNNTVNREKKNLFHDKQTVSSQSDRNRANSDPTTKKQTDTTTNKLLSFPPQLRTTPTKTQSLKLFYCNICLENHAEKDVFILESCQSQHKFCQNCIQTLLRIQVNDGQVTFPCPLFGECQGQFTVEEINSIADDQTKEKFLRLNEMKKDPNYRECPQCNQSCHGDPMKPEIICSSCQFKYCYFHSNAHPNSTCAAYNRQQLQLERDSHKAIKSLTRNCPSCGTPTEKNGGCNHMTCRQCGENWCWLCGRHMDGNHYDATNLLGCPGQQFTTAPSFALWTHVPPCCHTVLIVLVRILLVILAIPIGLPLLCIALAILIPLGIICLPCICCMDNENNDDSIGTIASNVCFGSFAVLILLLWLPFALVFSPVYFFLLSIGKVSEEPWVYFLGPAFWPFYLLLWEPD